MTIIQAQPLLAKSTGDVEGPVSALDNEVPVFDGITGKKIKAGSGVINPSAGRLDLFEIRAKDGNGLKLYDDGGAGLFIADGGKACINTLVPKGYLTIGATVNSVESRGLVLGYGDDKIEFVMSHMYNGFGVKMQGRVADGMTKLNYFARQASGSWPASPVMGIGSDNRVSVFNKGLYNVNSYTTATFEIGYSGNQWYGNYVFRIGSSDTTYGDWLTMDNAGRMSLGTATPNTSSILELNSTTGALLLPRMTTAQRNALTAVNGMVIYSTSNNRLEAYENGAWVDL